jgi:RNA polymerase II subunit A small phosphatase-like protein
MYIEPRPFANDFLIAAGQIFTVYVYTAGKKKYADTVLDHIDSTGVIEKRFYRDSCKKVNGNIIKDLRYLKKILREKKDMILVDDNADSIRHNYPFSLKI